MKTPMNTIDEIIPGGGTIETPLSKIVIPFNGRWKNTIFKREHQRIRRRERGLKQRIRVLDDGTKFVDVFPPPTKYEKRPKMVCPICNTEIYTGRWKGHLQSTKHRENTDLISRWTEPSIGGVPNLSKQFHTSETDQNCDQSDQCE